MNSALEETPIAALLDAAAAKLAASSDSPRLDAEVLLAHALGKPRSYLRAWPEHVPVPARSDDFDVLLARRRAGEPVAYLTGYREFFSLPLAVDSAVLVPRPETELLVELALARIPPDAHWRVLDAGTGSGAIALAIASRRPRCEIVASDVSAPALGVALRNAAALCASNVHFIGADWLASFQPGTFELIVSNPPYLRDDDPHLAGLRAEPRQALAAGADGLDAIRVIAGQARRCLRPRGDLMLEHGCDQRQQVVELLRHAGFCDLNSARDLGGLDRVTCGRAA